MTAETARLREFEDRDYTQLAEIEMAIEPESAPSAELLHVEDAVNEPRVQVRRLAATELQHAEALPDAHFLAYAGDQLVGVSGLARDRQAATLDQAFTGTHPEFRGRGIAQALKLRTVRYAQAHGYTEIRGRIASATGVAPPVE